LVNFQVYYLPLIGYVSGLFLAIDWLFFRFITCHWFVIFQVYYLPLIGYFSGLLLAIGWLFLQVYYLPLIGYFSGLLLAIDWLFFRFITCRFQRSTISVYYQLYSSHFHWSEIFL
jgi:hypothetical protein